ncbi:MAG: restriction endonuclease subunit S [Pseudonocardiaceae bacterium]
MSWTRTRLKFLADVPVRNGIGEPGEQDNPDWPRYVRTTDIAGPRELRSDTFKSLPPSVADGAKLLPGDLVMVAAGATVGKSYLHTTSIPACFAGYLVRFRAKGGVDPRFVAYWTQSRPYLDQVSVGAVRSTIDNVSAGKYQNLLLEIPDLEEQRRIADFLDAETRVACKITTLRAQQKVRIHERQSAELVARLLPAASGDGRSMTRLKHLFSSVRGGLWGAEPAGDDGDVICVRVADFDRKRMTAGSRAETRRSLDPGRLRSRVLRPGDVLLERSGGGDKAPVGCAVSFDGVARSVCSNFVAALRPVSGVHPRYAGLLLAACYHGGRTIPFIKQTTGIQNLDGSAYLAQSVALPSMGEQRGIARELDRSIVEHLSLAGAIDAQINLLAERRQALITAAVTGQLDVRTARRARE